LLPPITQLGQEPHLGFQLTLAVPLVADPAGVYDIGMGLSGGRLLMLDVDLSRSALARRMGLGFLGALFKKKGEAAGGDRVAWAYVEPLPEDLGSFKGDVKLRVLKEELSKLPPVDLADVLEGLGHEQRLAIFGALDPGHASDTLEALDPKVQRDVIAALDKEKVAQLVNEMTPGQAADLLTALPWPDAANLVELLPDREKASKVKAILEKQEEKVVDYTTSGFLRFDRDKLVARARVEFREAARGKAELTYIYVIDRDDHLLGVVESKALLLADDAARLRDIMTTKIVTLTPRSTLKVASETFARYLFRALPVVDETGKILGVLPYRDVVALRHRYVE
jgi:Mg/Co/Ni transporter MgtE